MSTVKSKKLQVGTDATSSNNFTIYQPATPDGTLRIGVGNADSPTEVGRFDSNGYVATNAPVFRVKFSADQSVSSAVTTKMEYNNIEYDTNNCYDISTHRFTPNVAGYYYIKANVYISLSTRFIMSVYKNGAQYVAMLDYDPDVSYSRIGSSSLVYCNGTTDYIEIYGYLTGSALTFRSDSATYFEGYLVRAV